MPSSPPHVKVRTAERPGSPDKPSEDRIFTTNNAVIVLDGASQPEATERNGGWLAEQLGSTLADRLRASPDEALANALAWSIATVADVFSLTPGDSPSTTVTIVRWTDKVLDVLALCDSPAVVMTTDGKAHLVEDQRLAAVTASLHRPLRYASDDPVGWHTLVRGQRQRRNRRGGYWVAEADPAAAHNAIQVSWPLADVSAVLAMTDGVSVGVERYGHPADWHEAAQLASIHPARLLEVVARTEEADPEGTRWPRSKPHDDKAAVIVLFTPRTT
jgi:hypothetical protein